MKKKKSLLIILMVCTAIIFYFGNEAVYALENENNGTLRSCGNIVFESKSGTIKLAGKDIFYLQDKLSSIPADVFSPKNYTYYHKWGNDDEPTVSGNGL